MNGLENEHANFRPILHFILDPKSFWNDLHLRLKLMIFMSAIVGLTFFFFRVIQFNDNWIERYGDLKTAMICIQFHKMVRLNEF